MGFVSLNEYRTLERAATVLRSYVRAEFPALDPATRIGAFMVAIVDELVAGCHGNPAKLAEALRTVQSGLRLFTETSVNGETMANGTDPARERIEAIQRRAAPRADRTMDEMMRDLEAIDDMARAFLAGAEDGSQP